MDHADETTAPHADVPDEELTPWQQLDRIAWHRVRMMSVRAKVRDYAARLLAEHGVDGACDRLPAGVSIDSQRVVRFDDQWAQDEAWRDAVAAVFDEVGDEIFDHLPPDTTIDAATGVVTVDAEFAPWW